MKINLKLRQTWLLVIVINWQLLANVRSCNILSEDIIEEHLSTKTPYRAVANWNDDPIEYKGKSIKLILMKVIVIIKILKEIILVIIITLNIVSL